MKTPSGKLTRQVQKLVRGLAPWHANLKHCARVMACWHVKLKVNTLLACWHVNHDDPQARKPRWYAKHVDTQARMEHDLANSIRNSQDFILTDSCAELCFPC